MRNAHLIGAMVLMEAGVLVRADSAAGQRAQQAAEDYERRQQAKRDAITAMPPNELRKFNGLPHQGAREVERRRRRLAKGKPA